MAELKPCPFCGGGNIHKIRTRNEHTENIYYYVICHDCLARITHNDPQEVVNAWNKRAEEKGERQ